MYVIVIKDEFVDVAGEVFDVGSEAGIWAQVKSAQRENVLAALVDQASGRGSSWDSAIEQRVKSDIEKIQILALVTKIAVWSKAAFAVVLRPDDHVHAAVENDVDLLADSEALDGRVTHDRNQQPALTSRVFDRVAKVRHVKERHSEELENHV